MKIGGRKPTILVPILIAIIISSFGIFPFIWIFSSSFKSEADIYNFSPSIFSHKPTLDAYRYVLRGMLGRNVSFLLILYRNSIVVSLSSVVLNTMIASLAGYGFARLKFRGRDAIFAIFIVLMFLPAGGTLMALYELMHWLHLRNSLLGLILIYSGGGGVGLFLMRQVFLNIPSQLEDSAKVDGASDLRIFFQIMMPLASGGMVLIALMQFMGVWGEYITAYTMIDYQDKMTLPIGLFRLSYAGANIAGAPAISVYASSITFMCLPILLLFIFLQRWFIRGAMEGLKF